MTAPADLEVRLRWASIAFVGMFAAALTAGIVLHIARPGSRMSIALLEAGLVFLMAAPAVRILIAVAERIRRRDWVFVLMTAIIVLELAIVLWRAATK